MIDKIFIYIGAILLLASDNTEYSEEKGIDAINIAEDVYEKVKQGRE